MRGVDVGVATAASAGSKVEAIVSLFRSDEAISTIAKELERFEPKDIIEAALLAYGQDAVVSTAFGAGGLCVMHMAQEVDANVRAYYIDTGFGFAETEEVLGETKVEGIRVLNIKTGGKQDIPVSGFFVAIGHKPNTDIFKGQLEMDEQGYLLVQAGSSRTNIPGVFAVGDCTDKTYRQAVTAAGSGCMGALDAERYLASVGAH